MRRTKANIQKCRLKISKSTGQKSHAIDFGQHFPQTTPLPSHVTLHLTSRQHAEFIASTRCRDAWPCKGTAAEAYTAITLTHTPCTSQSTCSNISISIGETHFAYEHATSLHLFWPHVAGFFNIDIALSADLACRHARWGCSFVVVTMG
jgi:hypothetical protein